MAEASPLEAMKTVRRQLRKERGMSYLPGVRVRSRVLLGETSALGEHTSGIFTFGHEHHEPTDTPATADIEIDAFVFMGNVHVILTDGPMLSVGDLVRDALSAVVDGFRRGWLAEAQRAHREVTKVHEGS